MNNPPARAEGDRGLLEKALQRSARLILHDSRREDFRPEWKIIAHPDRTADKFEVASERLRSQIQGVINKKPARRHIRTLPHIQSVSESDRIYYIIRRRHVRGA